MKKHVLIGILLSAIAAGSAWATIGDPAPVNPCPGAAPFKGKGYAILNVSGDGSVGVACANTVYAETAITCTSKEKAVAGMPKKMDVAIEYYDRGGNLISGALAVGVNTWCNQPPGATLTFYTDPSGGLGPPWARVGGVPGVFIPTVPVVPGPAGCAAGTPGCFAYGSARVLSTSTKIQCSATRIDFSGPCSGASPAPLASKNLTIIKSPAQKGD